jgi:hypothetical protein
MDMNFIHCFSEDIFNQLIEKGFTPLKNDYPFVLLNENKFSDLSVFGDAIEFSDKMLF